MRGISLMVEGKMRCFGGAQHDMRGRVISNYQPSTK